MLEESKRTLKLNYDKELNIWEEKFHVLLKKYQQIKEDFKNFKSEKEKVDNLNKEVISHKDAEIHKLKSKLLMQTAENDLFQQHNFKSETITSNPIETSNPVVEIPTIAAKSTETPSNPVISKPEKASKIPVKLQGLLCELGSSGLIPRYSNFRFNMSQTVFS
nr:500_t:CDS:2 [Entrophospora candida]